MTSLLQYRPLFNTHLLIDYYLTEETGLYQDTAENPMADVLEDQINKYDLERDFQILLTEETKRLLSDFRLLYKRTNFGFLVSVQVRELGDGTFVPFIDMDEAFSLRFAVFLKNPNFFNYTNIRLESQLDNKDQFIYYFSNRSNNIDTNNTLYLSEPMPAFNATIDYEASELIIEGTQMLEAIENNGPGPINNANWRQIFAGVDPLFQFVTNIDRTVTRPSIFKQNVENVNQEVLIYSISDINAVNVKSITFRTSEVGTDLIECQLDLSDLPSGLYTLEVQNPLAISFPELSLRFYKDDKINQQQPFALIECFHEPDGSLGNYRWLDHNNLNRLRFPEYVIRWKNRSTWWRYYHETAPNFNSTDVQNLDANVNSPNHRILISSDPLPLTHIGREVAIDILPDIGIQLLPNPDVNMIFPENGRLFSEINMGGGFGPPE